MRILLVGFGTVGRALAALVESSRERLIRQFGLELSIVGVVDSGAAVVSRTGLSAKDVLAAKLGAGLAGMPGGVTTKDPETLIGESDAEVLVQAVPSTLSAPEPAIAQLKAAFASHKHAVTATKAPLGVAMHGLLELASYNRVQLRYSATVGAGTPFLDVARNVGKGDHILSVDGVLNGTTNFILSAMHGPLGRSFQDALAEATRLGYAETDPSNDVDGIDTAMKLVILANHAMGAKVTFKDVQVQGIQGVTAEQVGAAKKRGKVIRLVGHIGTGTGTPLLSVSPHEIDAGSPLDLPGATNAAVFTMEECGSVTLRGSGAGGENTASAMLRDLVDIWLTTHGSVGGVA